MDRPEGSRAGLAGRSSEGILVAIVRSMYLKSHLRAILNVAARMQNVEFDSKAMEN